MPTVNRYCIVSFSKHNLIDIYYYYLFIIQCTVPCLHCSAARTVKSPYNSFAVCLDNEKQITIGTKLATTIDDGKNKMSKIKVVNLV